MLIEVELFESRPVVISVQPEYDFVATLSVRHPDFDAIRTAALLEILRLVESGLLEELRQSFSCCLFRMKLVQVLRWFEWACRTSSTRSY